MMYTGSTAHSTCVEGSVLGLSIMLEVAFFLFHELSRLNTVFVVCIGGGVLNINELVFHYFVQPSQCFH